MSNAYLHITLLLHKPAKYMTIQLFNITIPPLYAFAFKKFCITWYPAVALYWKFNPCPVPG
jgi:hypothetical protein